MGSVCPSVLLCPSISQAEPPAAFLVAGTCLVSFLSRYLEGKELTLMECPLQAEAVLSAFCS